MSLETEWTCVGRTAAIQRLPVLVEAAKSLRLAAKAFQSRDQERGCYYLDDAVEGITEFCAGNPNLRRAARYLSQASAIIKDTCE